MRIATWNVNSVTARLPRLLEWLGAAAPDVVCLQETKVHDDNFPVAALREAGYESAPHGDGRWNGVAILSRCGLDDVRTGLADEPGFPAPGQPQARSVAATCGGVRVWSVYVPNGRAVEDPHFTYKLEWLAALRAALAGESPAESAVMGDFNVAPSDADLWDLEAFRGSTHVTPDERRAVADILDLGFTDVMPVAQKGPHPFTYWDYRAGMFPKNLGMRIDLLLAGEAVASRIRHAYVDREARKGKGASDHAPIVADLD